MRMYTYKSFTFTIILFSLCLTYDTYSIYTNLCLLKVCFTKQKLNKKYKKQQKGLVNEKTFSVCLQRYEITSLLEHACMYW